MARRSIQCWEKHGRRKCSNDKARYSSCKLTMSRRKSVSGFYNVYEISYAARSICVCETFQQAGNWMGQCREAVEARSKRELEIRLKSGYFEDSNTRRDSEIRFSIASTPPTNRQRVSDEWKAQQAKKSYYFNGKYWWKIVFLFSCLS